MNDRILKSSFPADSTNELPAQDCSHQVSGNAINTLTNQAHQTPATGGVLPHSGIRPRPKPGASHFITVPAGHNKLLYSSQILQTFPNLNLSPLPPEGPTISTHQVRQQVSSHSGHLMSQTQDQHVFGSPTGDHLPNFPPRYDQLPDNRVQLSKLNTPSFNFLEASGENSGLSYDNPASGLSSSSRTPDSPVVGQLEIDWGSSGQTLTLQGQGDNVRLSGLTLDQPTIGQNGIIKPNQGLQSHKIDLSPGMRELTQQHEANLDLSLYGTSGGQMEMAKSEVIPGYQLHSLHDPSQASQPHLVVQQPTQCSPDHIGSSELLLPGRDKNCVPANTKHPTFKNTVPDLSGDAQGSLSTEPMSTATSRVDLNLERPGSIDRRSIETVQSRVQNIRVKPLSKFVSSGHHLNQKPFIRQVNSQSSNPSQYVTGPTAVSSDGNRWTSQQLPERTGLNIREVPERTGFSMLKQEQDVNSVRVKSDRSAVLRLTNLSTNQQIHQQKLVQSVAETGNGGGQESASTPRNMLQPTGRDGNLQPIRYHTDS